MYAIDKKNEWLIELNKELKKYFEEKETSEIIAYYDEMICDKLEHGEDIDDVISQYQVKKIATQMIPKIVSGRKLGTSDYKSNAKLITIILFSTPILIPLGIVYLSLMITGLSLVLSGVLIGISAVIGIIVYSVALIVSNGSFADIILGIGSTFIIFSLLGVIGYYLTKFAWYIVRLMSIWVSKLLVRKEKR